MSSPVSSLSSLSPSEDETEDVDGSSVVMSENDSAMPPSKRRRLSPPIEDEDTEDLPPIDDQDIVSDISSDTEGSVPSSPVLRTVLPDEHTLSKEFLQVCRWEGCTAGDVGNQDELVSHIHDIHIGNKKSIFKCGWDDCSRRGQTHASAYALRAHVRSHTKEKPFYCEVPECDRCFTRSDALSKHMRTVHETDQIRPADSSKRVDGSPVKAPLKIKLNVNKNSPSLSNNHASPQTPEGEVFHWHGEPLSPTTRAALRSPPPPDVQFTRAETDMHAKELFRLLKYQLQWAQQDAKAIAAEEAGFRDKHRSEWIAKELALENVFEGEYQRAGRRGVITEEHGNVTVVDDAGRPVPGVTGMEFLAHDAGAASLLPIAGRLHPWYRHGEPLDRSAEEQKPEQQSSAAEYDDVGDETEDEGT